VAAQNWKKKRGSIGFDFTAKVRSRSPSVDNGSGFLKVGIFYHEFPNGTKRTNFGNFIRGLRQFVPFVIDFPRLCHRRSTSSSNFEKTIENGSIFFLEFQAAAFSAGWLSYPSGESFNPKASFLSMGII
jgi:hypothetical protein